ncbi:MAG TPA: TetR/AcrR family transcriptional regulator [Methylophilaceae bacterium]|nr:TetR/AcrR family transcriptional regulator [Methylophilaceae bacterium]
MPSPSRDKLIAVARHLILERGFSAMSVNDVCLAAGVTKGSFFHHFDSKETLGEVVLEEFWQGVQDRQENAAYRSAGTPVARLLGYIDHAIDTYQNPDLRSGCLLAVYVSELRETHPGLYHKCIPHFLSWKSDVVSLLQDAVAQLSIKDQLEAEGWAEFYISTLEGALMLAKALNDPQVITRVLTLYRNQLASLLSSGNP